MLSIGSKLTAKLALLSLIFFGVLFLQIKLHTSLNQKVPSEINSSYVIDRGENLYSVLDDLEDKYDLQSTWWIRFNYIFKEAPVIKAGRYNILPNYSIKDLIDAFANGDVQQFKFTVIEGTVAKNNLKNLKEIFIKENISESLDPKLEALFLKEALIAPDTYFFSTQKDLIAVLEGSKSYLDDYLNSILLTTKLFEISILRHRC